MYENCQSSGKDPLKSDLWMAIKNQCREIVRNGNKRDWYWFKKVLLPSKVNIYVSSTTKV